MSAAIVWVLMLHAPRDVGGIIFAVYSTQAACVTEANRLNGITVGDGRFVCEKKQVI